MVVPIRRVVGKAYKRSSRISDEDSAQRPVSCSMETASAVFHASLGGSVQMLLLSGMGALISYMGHFSPSTLTALTKGSFLSFSQPF